MAYRGGSVTTSGDASGTTLVISRPVGAALDDILRLHVYVEDQTLTMSASPGVWTLIPAASGECGSGGTAYEIHELWSRQGAESGDITVSWGGANVWRAGICAAWSGRIASGDPLDVISTYTEADPTDTTAFLATGVTTTTNDADLVIMGGSIQATAWGSWTAGITEQVEFGNNVLATGTQAVAGATGNKTATLSVSANWTAALTALSAAVAGAVADVAFRSRARPFPFRPGSPPPAGR